MEGNRQLIERMEKKIAGALARIGGRILSRPTHRRLRIRKPKHARSRRQLAKEFMMGREDFIGRRAYKEDTGHTGVIIDVHLDVRPQTAKFQHDGTDASDAEWVNLAKLRLLPPE